MACGPNLASCMCFYAPPNKHSLYISKWLKKKRQRRKCMESINVSSKAWNIYHLILQKKFASLQCKAAVFSQRKFCPQGTFDSGSRHFCLSQGGGGGGRDAADNHWVEARGSAEQLQCCAAWAPEGRELTDPQCWLRRCPCPNFR